MRVVIIILRVEVGSIRGNTVLWKTFLFFLFWSGLALQYCFAKVKMIDWYIAGFCNKVVNLGNNTFGNPYFQKVLTNKPSSLMRPRMLCLALPPSRKVPKLDFQCEFSMSKIIWIFLIFFTLKIKNLGAHFVKKKYFLVTSILKPLFY